MKRAMKGYDILDLIHRWSSEESGAGLLLMHVSFIVSCRIIARAFAPLRTFN